MAITHGPLFRVLQRTRASLPASLLALLSIAGASGADTTYSYAGNWFTNADEVHCFPGDRVEGWFTLASALPPDQPDTDISGQVVDYEFWACGDSCDITSTSCDYLFYVSTDGAGSILHWYIIIEWNGGSSEILTSNPLPGVADARVEGVEIYGLAWDDPGQWRVTVCGDGLVGGVETCDDGGTNPGDGCDATCQIEPGWQCEGEPSVCTSTLVPALSLWPQMGLVAGLIASGLLMWRRRAA